MDYKEYARQLRENAARDENGVIRCSPELWEQIASIIENIDKPNTKPTRNQHGNCELKDDEIVEDLKQWISMSKNISEPVFLHHIVLQRILDLINRLKKENDDLFYKLNGVMWSVDKWLDGDELKKDEVNRAITMREKTLQITEKLQAEVERLLQKMQQAYGIQVEVSEKVEKEIKSEAIKEFAERLKERINTDILRNAIMHSKIDNLVKEMVGEE